MKVFISLPFLCGVILSLLVAISHCQVQAQIGNFNYRNVPGFGGPSFSQFVDRGGDLIPQESYHYQSSYYPSHHHGHGHGGHGHGHGGHGHGHGGHGHGHGGYGHGGHGHGWHRPRRVYHIYHSSHHNQRSRVLPSLLAGLAAGSALAIGAGIATGGLGK